MTNYDDPMTERAAEVWARRSRANGISAQPSSARSYRDGNVVVLANVNGELARYKVTKRRGSEGVRFIS